MPLSHRSGITGVHWWDAAFPNPSNTGFPNSATLTTYTGPATITTDNTVIDSVIFQPSFGRLTIQANNVTIQNSLHYCTDFFAFFSQTNAFNVKNTTIVGPYDTGTSGISTDFGGNFDRVVIRGFENFFVGGGVGTITNCYMYDLQNSATAHPDGIQFGGGQTNWLVQHNRIEVCGNAGIYITTDFGDITGITCIGNLILMKPGDPANFAMFIDQKVAGGHTITNIVQTDNILQRGFLGYESNNIPSQLTWARNIDYITNAQIAQNS